MTNKFTFTTRVIAILRSMRPAQWTKNAVVFAAYIFALSDRQQQLDPLSIGLVAAAALCFCLLSSAIYLMNDVRDQEQDRLHPVKRLRPVAAGQLSTPFALTLSVLLASGALIGSLTIATQLTAVLGLYLIIQIAYTLGLKKIALVDIFVIAGGFVLRALAGAVAINVDISPWLLLCTLLLALFLALCKRRHEKVVLSHLADNTRSSLQSYDAQLLDQLIAIVSSATVVCYALYTLWPDTVEKFGTHKLGFTIPFVLFGLFRYLDLVYRHEKGGRPEKILLTDIPLLIDLALYGLTVLLILL
jgi:4-hydroxybenzoate polyprenyltransferase